MAQIILLNKPFNVLCQFRDSEQRTTLAHFIESKKYPNYYPAGRLDFDSEGLVILTNNGSLQHRIAHPANKLSKTYWVQVDGEISDSALEVLRSGVDLKDGRTKPAKVKRMNEPKIWPRTPPIRQRLHQPTSWIELVIQEGKNRQVRRMTAAAGYPTLRLIRRAVGDWNLGELAPGEFYLQNVNLPQKSQSRSYASKKSNRVSK